MVGILVVPVLLHVSMAADVTVWFNDFIRCEDKDACSGIVLDASLGISTVQCAAACLRNDFCRAVSVCPQAGSLRQVVCRLLEDASHSGNITANKTSEICFQRKKVRCENGGTLLNGQCRCPVQFAGTSCQRRVRDCKEASDNGCSEPKTNVPLLIQPVASPTPFWVMCRFDLGVSYPLERKYSNYNVNWTTAKTGFGDNLSVKNNSKDFFVGLDNLHYLVGQAEYKLSLYFKYNKSQNMPGAFYHRCAVGNESSNYALSYQTFSSNSQYPADNGFFGSLPLVFSTNDHDTNSCRKGYPGWFSSNCSGYSLFADRLVWPINGTMTDMDYTSMGLIRTSHFTID